MKPSHAYFCMYGLKTLEVTTHGLIKLFTLLVKYFNDLLGRQNAEQGKKFQTFHCSNVTIQ